MMMVDADITAFAEMLFTRFGEEAPEEAMRRARHCRQKGDSKNAEAWLRIRQKLGAFGLAPAGFDPHAYI